MKTLEEELKFIKFEIEQLPIEGIVELSTFIIGLLAPHTNYKTFSEETGYCCNPLTNEDNCLVLAKKNTCEGCKYYSLNRHKDEKV